MVLKLTFGYIFIEKCLSNIGDEVLGKFIGHELKCWQGICSKRAGMFFFRFAGLGKFGDRVCGEIAGGAGILQEVVIVSAVNGAVDFVDWGEGT